MLLIGDGILSTLDPKRHCLLWEVGPEFCREMIGELADHPAATRLIGVAEAAFGLWLASQQQPTLADRIHLH
jgi:hypothetical protein